MFQLLSTEQLATLAGFGAQSQGSGPVSYAVLSPARLRICCVTQCPSQTLRAPALAPRVLSLSASLSAVHAPLCPPPSVYLSLALPICLSARRSPSVCIDPAGVRLRLCVRVSVPVSMRRARLRPLGSCVHACSCSQTKSLSLSVRLIHANTGSLPSASLPRTAARLERAAASAVCTFRLRPCPDVTVKLLLAPPSLASVQRVKCLPEETVRGR